MSIPLAAMSVATIIDILPVLNFLSVVWRAFCDLLPWIASQTISALSSERAILSAPCLVFEKIRADLPSSLFSTSISAFTFCLLSTLVNCCSIVSTTEDTGATSTRSALLSISSDISTISSGIVAENSIDCLAGGSLLSMRLISWINPISSIQSASSSTKCSRFPSFTCPWPIRSSSLPGVAISISVPWRSLDTCGPWLTPPNITVCFRNVCLPYSANDSDICIASSLVGLRISALSCLFARFSRGLCRSCSIIGIANAAVFPVPVCAIPRMSLPDSSTGIALLCIAVGSLYSFSLSDLIRGSLSPISLKVIKNCSFSKIFNLLYLPSAIYFCHFV